MALAAVSLVVLGVLAVVHVAVAALSLRFLRVQMATTWSPYVYAALLVPLVYTVSSLVVLGALGIGAGVELGRGTLLVALFAVPFALGVAIDVLWMPAPEDVELPAELQ